MKNRNTRALVAIVVVVICAPVSAAEVIDRADAQAVISPLFNALDCEIDGVVEPGEVDDHFAQLWHPLDRDRSRALDRREYAMTHRQVEASSARALFADADANADGEIAFREFGDHIKRMLLLLDTDGDREVSRTDAGLKPFPAFKARRFTFAKPSGGEL